MKTPFVSFIGVTAIVIALYLLGVRYGLFYGFWWYDNVLHILGGIALGFLGLRLFGPRFWATISLTGTVAIAWEVFEHVGHAVAPMYIGYGGAWDTIFDIACGILGASLVLWSTRGSNNRPA
jgi:asparagine N-glycosylation enzyme membrane subunit Stt3